MLPRSVTTATTAVCVLIAIIATLAITQRIDRKRRDAHTIHISRDQVDHDYATLVELCRSQPA